MIQITMKQKIYAAALLAALVFAAAAVETIRSRMAINRLEREAAVERGRAARGEQAAAAAESAAERQAAQAQYLEQQLKEIRAIASRQDEELKKIFADTAAARGRVDRARRVRSIESTTAELCAKLESLGYRCGE